MANPAIVLAPPGLGGPPAAPAPAVAPPAGAPGGAREGAAMEVERHDIASNNEDDSAMPDDGGARVVLRPNLAAQVQAMEGRIQSLEDTVQELTALVVDLQASQANLLERNLRGERSPPPS